MAHNELPPGFRPGDATAGDRAETDYTAATFSVKEHPPLPGEEPPAWIMVEPNGPGLKVLRGGDAFLGLECREGVTLAEATKLASDLRRLVVGISCTKFVT